MLMATISSGQLSVSGVIQDALTGEPIIGGTIYVAGSSDGTSHISGESRRDTGNASA